MQTFMDEGMGKQGREECDGKYCDDNKNDASNTDDVFVINLFVSQFQWIWM